MKKLVLHFFLILIITTPFKVGAATLHFSPTSNSYDVGNSFLFYVFVSSADQSMNAASGVISFPKDKLEVVSLSKNSSIFSFWVQEPSFSNNSGTINFEGVVLNPGFIGNSGKLLSITFKIKSAGDAPVSFSSGSILANDGQGTNILTNLGKANFVLKAASYVEKKEKPEASSVSEQTGVETKEAIIPPEISYYPKEISKGEKIQIRGSSYIDSKVTIFFKYGNETTSQIILTDSNGEFTFINERELEEGVYKFWATATHPSGLQSAPSDQFVILVKPSLMQRVVSWVMRVLTLLVPLIGLTLLLTFIFWVLWHKFSLMRKRLKLEIKEAEEALHKSFKILQEDTDSVSLKKDLSEAEKFVGKEIRDINKELD